VQGKPVGVGIKDLSLKELIDFGVANGHIDENHMHAGAVVVGALLPDWAIRQFITIEDFVDYDDCPPNVVSFGLSSAGYDLRVSGRFKVFTNANCETVSPRRINPGSFVDRDVTGHTWHTQLLADAICTRCGCNKSERLAQLRCKHAKEDLSPVITIPPNSFALAETVERLHIPTNVSCLCLGKSTYARCGIIMNFTPFEPGWRGIVTVEISNSTPLPVEITAWQGIGQAQFSLTVGRPERTYAQKKNAKYQDQTGLTLPRVM